MRNHAANEAFIRALPHVLILTERGDLKIPAISTEGPDLEERKCCLTSLRTSGRIRGSCWKWFFSEAFTAFQFYMLYEDVSCLNIISFEWVEFWALLPDVHGMISFVFSSTENFSHVPRLTNKGKQRWLGQQSTPGGPSPLPQAGILLPPFPHRPSSQS